MYHYLFGYLPYYRLPGVEHILVSNLYGLPILRASTPSYSSPVLNSMNTASSTTSASNIVNNTLIPYEPIESIYATLFAITAEHIEKIMHHQYNTVSSLNKNPTNSNSTIHSSTSVQTIITVHSGHILIQAAIHPLVFAIVGQPTIDIDKILSIIPTLITTFDPLRIAATDYMTGN